MSNLLSSHPQATAWAIKQRILLSPNSIFGTIASAVIWTGEKNSEGELLVPASPAKIIEEINKNGMPLLRGHDPGAPQGRVIAAKIFEGTDNSVFVAAILGLYAGGTHLRFEEFGYVSEETTSCPLTLPALDGTWIEFSTDSREVSPAWVEEILSNAPLPVERAKLSLNSAESASDLITIGLVYVALVWNPYVTEIAKEGGKDTYRALHAWLRKLWDKLGERNSPIINIQSQQDGCVVSFIIRGNKVDVNYAAHDALPGAATEAAKLIANIKKSGASPAKLVYEYDVTGRWFPSYAELSDGRFVNNKNILIALEQLPSGLSLGLRQ